MQLVCRGNDVPFAELFDCWEVPVFYKHLTMRNCELLGEPPMPRRFNWLFIEPSINTGKLHRAPKLAQSVLLELWSSKIYRFVLGVNCRWERWSGLADSTSPRTARKSLEKGILSQPTLVWRFQAQLHVAAISVANEFVANGEGVLSLAMYESWRKSDAGWYVGFLFCFVFFFFFS